MAGGGGEAACRLGEVCAYCGAVAEREPHYCRSLEPPPGRDRRPIALWCVPRSASTAFDRMVRERGDLQVFTEPFSEAYYFGPERRSARFPPEPAAPAYDTVLARVADGARPTFVKDMPHHLGPRLDRPTLRRFVNTFLVRDPARTIPSLARHWPDFTDHEAGFGALRVAFELVRDDLGHDPPVIDAADLLAEPAGTVAAWCDAVGLVHRPGALRWTPGPVEGWERWRSWFARAEASDGLHPVREGPVPEAPPDLAGRIERHRADYEIVAAARLHPTAPEPPASGPPAHRC